MEIDLIRCFLPEELLNYFDIIKVEKAKDETLNRDVLHIYLDEKNEIRSVLNLKGFYPSNKSMFELHVLNLTLH